MRTYKIVRSSIVLLLITVLLTAAVTIPAGAQYGTMQYQYNAAHTGDYGPVAGSTLPNDVQKWSFPTGSVVLSSPAVVNGVVYVGSWDNNVYAIYASNGTKLWNYLTGAPVESSPAVVNGVVYVGSDDHNIYALNASSGAKVWNYTTGSEVHSSPAVANDVVYVGSDDGNVYALNASTGAKLWNYVAGGLVDSSPAVVNGVVYVGSYDNNIYAIGNSAAGVTPGFDVALALVGLAIVAYIARRKS